MDINRTTCRLPHLAAAGLLSASGVSGAVARRATGGRRRSSPGWRILATLALLSLPLTRSFAAATPVIRAGSEIAYPPFCLVDAQQRADGFSVELLREALRAMNCDVDFRVGEWNDVRHWLERGEVDALPLVGRTPEREPLYDFTFPYMTLYGAIVVRADASGIASLEDLLGRKVAVMRGDNAEEFMRRQGMELDLRATPTFEQALRELSEGRHEAVVMQRLVALRLLGETGLSNLRLLPRPIDAFRQDFCFAVHKGDAATLALLNEGLSLAIADGTYRRLHAKWFAALELPSDQRIIFGGDQGFPPYEFFNAEGEPDGFAVDLSRSLARAMGLDIEVRLARWDQALHALENGEIDVLQGIFYSDTRSRKFDFTVPHAYQHYVAVVRAGAGPPPEAVAALQGRSLAVQRGDWVHDALASDGWTGAILALETQEAVLDAVADGRAGVGVVARLSAARSLERRALPVVLGKRPLYSAEYCMAVRKGNMALLTQLNEGLRLLQESGEYRKLQEKWLGVNPEASPFWRMLARYLAWFAGGGGMLFALVLLWNRALQRRVTTSTRELRASETFLRAVFDAVNDGVLVVDIETQQFMVGNAAMGGMLGCAPDALARMTLADIHPAEAFDKILEHFDRHGRGEGSNSEEVPVLRRDGTSFRAHVSAAPLALDGRRCVVGVFRDITQRLTLENQLRQSQKMEAVGRLAGGVAHDFNNLLMAILGYVELAKEQLPPDHPAQQDLQEVVRNTQRSADLTRQLLAFARRQTIVPKRIDLGDTVASMLKLLRRLLGEPIEVVLARPTQPVPVMIDPSQVDQILMNLCVNARDAIAGSGRLVIETDVAVIDAAYCDQHADALPGDYAMLAVSDSGSGMPPEVLSHVFEPFFTTKAHGIGTGLGLATVYGIVRQNRGFVNVYSEVGRGTTFKIYLPLAGGRAAANAPHAEPAAAEPSGGTETLLLVEDEPAILKSTARFLASLGYTVLACSTPEEALQQAAAHAGPIPLLVTDVILPGLNGRELSDRLRESRPAIKTLFMSGYTANVIVHQGVLDQGANFLQKPVSMEALASRIRTLLTSESLPANSPTKQKDTP
jgi:two-component system sensor histidine kinase EvgS